MSPAPPPLPLDALPDPGDPIEVRTLAGFSVKQPRDPHRHDYHELIWVRSGTGRHSIDGIEQPVRPSSITLIGRGQVHVFEQARDLRGGIVRFTEAAVLGSAPVWLLAGRGGRTIAVPPGEADTLDALITALERESASPPDVRTPQLQRHLLSALLLMVERWVDAGRIEHPDPDDAEQQLHRRFTELLERDFARHHDAAHYATALGVPPAALSRALSQVTGHGTKELVGERVMLEAARLLRFTDLAVQQVAQAVGFPDPLYFSRAFKRRTGDSPQAYRDRVRGKSIHR